MYCLNSSYGPIWHCEQPISGKEVTEVMAALCLVEVGT